MTTPRSWIMLLVLLTLPAVVQAQFTYTTNAGAITITQYTGPGGVVVIPSSTNSWPVNSIGDYAFEYATGLTSVAIPNSITSIGAGAFAHTGLTNFTIPDSVTNIGDYALVYCYDLTTITVDAFNSLYSSMDGVLFNKSQAALIQYPASKPGSSYAIPNTVTNIGLAAFESCTSLTNLTIPSGVTVIQDFAFDNCSSLTSVTIPNSVTSIGDLVFQACVNLTGLYFQGNAPSIGPSVFALADNATVYYLPGTTGWSTTFGGRPTALWTLTNPLILINGSSLGVRTNGFGFIISSTTNLPIVVEASTNLASARWTSLQSYALSNSSIYFSDPAWTNSPARFYRVRSP